MLNFYVVLQTLILQTYVTDRRRTSTASRAAGGDKTQDPGAPRPSFVHTTIFPGEQFRFSKPCYVLVLAEDKKNAEDLLFMLQVKKNKLNTKWDKNNAYNQKWAITFDSLLRHCKLTWQHCCWPYNMSSSNLTRMTFWRGLVLLVISRLVIYKVGTHTTKGKHRRQVHALRDGVEWSTQCILTLVLKVSLLVLVFWCL